MEEKLSRNGEKFQGLFIRAVKILFQLIASEKLSNSLSFLGKFVGNLGQINKTIQ